MNDVIAIIVVVVLVWFLWSFISFVWRATGKLDDWSRRK